MPKSLSGSDPLLSLNVTHGVAPRIELGNCRLAAKLVASCLALSVLPVLACQSRVYLVGLLSNGGTIDFD